MNKQEKDIIRALIAKDRTGEAIQEILDYLEDDLADDKFSKEINKKNTNSTIILNGRNNRLKLEQISGVLSDSVHRIEKNRINQSVLHIVDSIPEITNNTSLTNSFEDLTFKKRLTRKINSLQGFRQATYDFYLSYSKQDVLAANEIYKNLVDVGFKVFKSDFIESGIYGATEKENIRYALNDSQTFILYSSPGSMESDRVGMEYDRFYKTYHQTNPDTRLFFIFQPEDFIAELLPTFSETVKTTNSIAAIANDFISLIKDQEKDKEELLSKEFQFQKDKIYDSLKENVENRNIIQCPNCSYPLKKSEPIGIFMFSSFLICTLISFYLGYHKIATVYLVLLSVLGGFVGTMFFYLIGGVTGLVFNKRFASTKAECKNCHYILAPRDKEKLYREKKCKQDELEDVLSQDFHISIEDEIGQIRKYFKRNAIVGGLKELKILFLRKKDKFSSNEAQILINEFLENLEKAKFNSITEEEYTKKEEEVIRGAFKLLSDYEGYISLLRTYAIKDKDFNSNYLAFSELLEKINCKKYLRLIIENGYDFKDFWQTTRQKEKRARKRLS